MSSPSQGGGRTTPSSAEDEGKATAAEFPVELRPSGSVAGPNAEASVSMLPTATSEPPATAGYSGTSAEGMQGSSWQQLIQLGQAKDWWSKSSKEQNQLLDRLDSEVRQLSAQDIKLSGSEAVQLLEGLAELNPPVPGERVLALERLLTIVLKELSTLTLGELISVLEALAELRYHPGAALESICAQAFKRQHGGSWQPEDASRICFADEALGGGHAVQHIIPLIAADQPSSRPPWKLKDLGRLLWALAAAAWLSEEAVELLSIANIEDGKPMTETLRQIAAAWLAAPFLQNKLPQGLLLAAKQAWRQEIMEAKIPQEAEEVAAVLSYMRVLHHRGLMMAGDFLRLDIAVPSSRTAIFLDGPQAFCFNSNSAVLGSTRLKWRLAAKQGWSVVSLQLQDWAACADFSEKMQYLTQLLQGPPALSAEIVGSTPGSSVSDPMLLRGDSPEQAFAGMPEAGQPRLTKASLQSMHLPTMQDSVFDKAVRDPGLSAFSRGVDAMSDGTFSTSTYSSQDAASTLYGWRGVHPYLHPHVGNLPQYQSNHIAFLQQQETASRLGEMGLSMPAGPLSSLLESTPAELKDLRGPLDIAPHLMGGSLLQGMGQDILTPGDPGRGAPLPLPGSQLFPLAQPLSGVGPLLGGPYMSPDKLPYSHGLQTEDYDRMFKDVLRDQSSSQPKAVHSITMLKREVERLNLDPHAPQHLRPLLRHLDPLQFATLLSELARDNAFRAWQIFDWVRTLNVDDELFALCDVNTYVTMISLCGVWQQPDRALALADDLLGRGVKCGIEVYGPLHSTMVKCGRGDVAWRIYELTGQENMARDKTMFHTMVDVLVKMNRPSDALKVLDDMKKAKQPAEVQLYNLIVLSCTKMNNPRAVLDVYKRMAEDGVQPNTKTFTALIGSVGKMNTVPQTLNIIEELLSRDQDTTNLTQTYSALMSACEKAGQCELAVALFEKMSSQGCKPDVSIFNSMIAACAHGGEYLQARLMFERMAEHDCAPDAVTYANLIRAYKKGGQWCHALDTFEAMQNSGCKPHAAVFSSIIDVLWQTGSAWAQAKALRLFNSAVENGSLAGAAESCKKGTLKVDLQALTVGVAVLSMAAWLKKARHLVLQDQAGPLSSSRKLAVVNGLGEHSRAQGHSAAVKEAVGAGLLGCKAPFRLVQDHSRSGRLEASTLALQKWLISSAFEWYLKLLQGSPEMLHQDLLSTPEYMRKENEESAKCTELFKKIKNYEAKHPLSLKVLHRPPGAYQALHKQLVAVTLQYRDAFNVPQETAHTALALMDRCMLAGMHPTDPSDALLICACLRIAAGQESSQVPEPLLIQALTNIPAVALEREELAIRTALNDDTESISAVHCLKVYLQRLGVDLRDDNAVRLASGCAFVLSTSALSEMPTSQYSPSMTAAALLVAARKAQGSVPFWPSVLAQLTSYTESGSPPFAAAISAAERLCSKLYSMQSIPELRFGGVI